LWFRLSFFGQKLKKKKKIKQKKKKKKKKSQFATMTNVNFSADRIQELVRDCYARMDKIASEVAAAGGAVPSGPAALWRPSDSSSIDALVHEAKAFSVPTRQAALGEDVAGLQELIVYALKGVCAYASHARALDKVDPEVNKYVCETLAWLDGSAEATGLAALLGRTLATGEISVKVMSMLDAGHTERLGNPTPAAVTTTAIKGKAILFSGHDMRDLEALLQQTAGKGINVWTHGEMLPAHGYPKLRDEHPHLVGHYGGAWQLQKFEFKAFPGPIVVSTNCIIEPRKGYKDRIFTMNVVGFPGVKHIKNRDFSEVMALALADTGFTETVEPAETVMTGFGHNTVVGIAPAIIDAIKAGQITRFNLIGGCDGSEAERSVFTDIGRALPKTEVALTLGCGKYRINRLPELQGNIPGTEIPRLVDVGQCNDAYGAVVIASALAKALGCGLNDLPLNYYVSHLEQKAAAVLVAMLHLNIQNIQLGPTLPAFITPAVLDVLVEKFALAPVTGPAQ
jgi:hydroxylamine reductase